MRFQVRTTLLTGLIFLAPTVADAQGTIWIFGDGAGLDFGSGTPVIVTGGASYSLDNSTAATDATGDLLFYSNGESVWDATHTIMPNGNGLLGDHDAGQCALAVHRPGTNIFYLFTVDNWNGVNGLRYSIVDMDLNGGLGDVTIKNQLLHTPSTERLEAVRNASNDSWWLISHDWGNNNFRAYQIDANGLNTTPVISSVGAWHSGALYDSAGQLTASPDGTMLCCGIYTQNMFQVFDFDVSNGVVSNPRNLPGYTNAWGCAFSPNNQRLYLTKWYNDEVWQVDLTAATWAQVQSSAVLVGTTAANVSGWQAGFLQLGPDQRIYMATFGENSMACIVTPNALGSGCGFADASIGLGSGVCNAGLCRTATSDVCTLGVSLPMPSGCAWSPLTIDAQVSGTPASWIWDLGDGSSSTLPPPLTHTYITPGLYTVSVIVSDPGGNCVDSAQTTILIGAPESAGADTSITLCTSDPPLSLLTLLSTDADMNGMWMDQAGTSVPNSFDPSVQSSTTLLYVINGVHCGPDTATISIAVEICTGTGEMGVPSQVVVFPVPAYDNITIILPTGPLHWSIALLDINGRVVRTIAPQGGAVINLGLDGIAAGKFILQLDPPDGQRRLVSLVKAP